VLKGLRNLSARESSIRKLGLSIKGEDEEIRRYGAMGGATG
jgi:hypothetical protein